MSASIEIARKCISAISDGWGEKEDEKVAHEIVDIIDAAIAAEREACARIADTHSDAFGSQDECDQIAARTGAIIAEEIRARREAKK